MKISSTWLKDYIPFDVSPKELAHKLTMAGLEVERIEKVSGDTVFELEITPNRPDCLNVIGIAREVSAIFNKSLKHPKFVKVRPPKNKVSITIEDKKACPRYVGTIIQNVDVAETPGWIKKRLTALGSRPINNIVDITNFCLFEQGQPLHAFDYDQLIGGKIIVRRAKKGERILTLDGEDRVLDPSILVIADAKRPVAIAGVMGGKETEVTERTKNILLESAYFDPALIRQAARSLGLSSDSSYRFERGVNFHQVDAGAQRAISLIKEYAQGTVYAYTDKLVQKKEKDRKSIKISLSQVNSLLGAKITSQKCRSILKKLGFQLGASSQSILKVTPPEFRSDIQQEVDVVEEIARVIGYDNLPSSLPDIPVCEIQQNIQPSSEREVREGIRRVLLSLGFDEAITYAMTNQKNLEKTAYQDLPVLRIQNPLTLDQEFMRPALAPNLLSSFVLNANRGQQNVKLFEIGKVYSKSQEQETLGVLAAGNRCVDWRAATKEPLDFYDLKGALEELFRRAGVTNHQFIPSGYPLFESGLSAQIKVGGKGMGFVGQVAQGVLNHWKIRQKGVFFAQLDLDAFYGQKQKTQRYRPISEFPAVVRDVSISLKKELGFADVQKVIAELNPDFLVDLKFTEHYMGEKVPAGFRGISFSLMYQSSERTLTESEVNPVHESVCQAILSRLGAVGR